MGPAQKSELERYFARWRHLEQPKNPPPVRLRRPSPPPVQTPPIPRRPAPERLEVADRYAGGCPRPPVTRPCRGSSTTESSC